MFLSAISKKIIISRLMDKNISAMDAENYVDNVIIESENFIDNNTMYSFIVDNYNKLIIGLEAK